MNTYPFYRQSYQMDCGPTCLRMVAEYFDQPFFYPAVANIEAINQQGASMLDLLDAATGMGLNCRGMEIAVEDLPAVALPAILHWDKSHFVVLYDIRAGFYLIADPAAGLFISDQRLLQLHWINGAKDGRKGVLLSFSIAVP